METEDIEECEVLKVNGLRLLKGTGWNESKRLTLSLHQGSHLVHMPCYPHRDSNHSHSSST